VSFDLLFRAGALVDLLLCAICFAVLLTGVWIWRNPAGFWDQFNPYLQPYHRATLVLGKVIGSLWAFGAALACVVLIGNAIRESLRHHWIR
jgi:hypothetical protein